MAAITSPPAANSVTSGSPARVIFKLALPTIVAMLTQSIVNEIDIVFFARLPCPESSNAQAALLPSLILLWLFGGSLSAVSVGTQAFTGRRFAEKRFEDAGAVLTNAAFFAVLAGIVFSALGYLTLLVLPRFLAPAVAESAIAYLKWRLFGIMSMAATFALKAFFDGIGKTHVHFVSAVIMNVVNIILCYLLIFGNDTLHLPKMGIAGAGIAGLVSTYVGLAIMIGFALMPEYRRLYRPFLPRMVSKSLMWSIVKLSMPSGAATAFVMTGFLGMVWVANRLDVMFPAGLVSPTCPGGTAEPVNLAATTVIVGILKLTFTACLAFGTSTATLVAQSLGEKKPERAELFGWTSVRLGIVIFGIVGLLEAAFAPQILSLVSKSELVIQAALVPMRIMGVCTPLIAIGMILTQALFGAGNTKFVMLVELVLHFTCLVPLAWLLGVKFEIGLVGLWLAAVIYVVLLAGAMAMKFKSGDWKRIQL